jgi:hypothetical protein
MTGPLSPFSFFPCFLNETEKHAKNCYIRTEVIEQRGHSATSVVVETVSFTNVNGNRQKRVHLKKQTKACKLSFVRVVNWALVDLCVYCSSHTVVVRVLDESPLYNEGRCVL